MEKDGGQTLIAEIEAISHQYFPLYNASSSKYFTLKSLHYIYTCTYVSTHKLN